MLSEKDKQDVAGIVAIALKELISAKKPESTEKKTEKKGEKAPPEHKKADIPTLINSMSPGESKELFGNILEREPYQLDISKFYREKNIVLEDKGKYKDTKNLTLEQKHLVIMKQLSVVKKSVFNSEKKRHIAHLQNKIAHPPETNMFGRELTDKNIESINTNLQKQIDRWNVA
jgi:hypothetical protein